MIVFLLLYLALVLIRPQDYPVLEGLGFPVLPLALALAFGVWLVERSPKSFAAPTYPLFAGFILAAMASVAVNGWLGGAMEMLGLFLPMLVAFTLVAHAARSGRNVIRLMVTIVLCSVVLVLHGIEQVELGEGWTGMPVVAGGRIQYVGIFSDPNDLAMLFVCAVPMALLLGQQGGLLGLRRLWWWLIAAALIYGVYLSDSRGAFLALLVMLGVWIWRRRGLLAAGALGTAGMAVLMLLPTRLQELDASEASAHGRIDAWYEGIQMFIGHPVLGVGVNNFTEYNYLTAHNSFVLVLAETGIIGFTVWLALVGYPFLMAVAVLRHQPALDAAGAVSAWRDERAVATTLLVSLSGFFACAFFLSRSYMILVYLMVALVTGWYMGAQQRWPTLPTFRLGKDWVRWAMIAMGGVVALYIVVKVLLALGA
jgi:putative inorganic carbon (HCO3(-)) transporter